MSFSFETLKNNFDVVIVGGGINGTGIARDLSLRGINCLLVEKNDFSAGTSGASSGMIHGGARYLLSDWKVTQLSCLDSGYIQKIVPHLLFRIPFIVPVYSPQNSLKDKLMLSLTEGFFATYDRFVELKNGLPHTRLTSEECFGLIPEIKREGLLGAVSFDEWGIDVARLCTLNAVDAAQNGSTILNHVTVSDIKKTTDGAQFFLKNNLTGTTRNVLAKIVINAAGPWSPLFAQKLGLHVPMRPGKGIHLILDRRLCNVSVVCKSIDHRQVFIMPYENHTVIGTTDDDFFDDLDRQRSTDDEIDYLIEAVCQVLPDIKKCRITFTKSGVRPTLYSRGPYEDDLSREHEIIDHSSQGLKMYSIIGGKLASYRLMSEEMGDRVVQNLSVGNKNLKSQTSEKNLPGASKHFYHDSSLPVDFYTQSQTWYRHGEIAKNIFQSAEKPRVLCACEGVTDFEIIHCLENEAAQTLSDLRRRTRLGQGPCQGLNCLRSCAAILQKNKLDCTVEIQNHLSEWWHNRAIALSETQLANEELLQAIFFANDCLDLF